MSAGVYLLISLGALVVSLGALGVAFWVGMKVERWMSEGAEYHRERDRSF